MTVKEFRDKAYGINEYQIWEGANLLTIFNITPVIVPEKVANKKIINFEFETNYDKIICIINVES